jgi:RNA polymerase sigma-70 factor (ECF subfamily)
MADASTFAEFVCRIRAGDERAARELVRQYEPLIRREVRLHLEDQRLCRLFDSLDVCQSVLASFFVRAAVGQYDLENPENLLKLLVRMTRNKLASAARQQRRHRRDQRRLAADGVRIIASLPDEEPSPSRQVASKELLERFLEELGPEEKQLAELRGQGLAWADVAERLGGTAQARRMQLSRAVDRVARRLGLEDSHHE